MCIVMQRKRRECVACAPGLTVSSRRRQQRFSDEGDDNVMELEEQSVGEDSDEEEVRPLTIKADASMRKHLTPAVHAGAEVFLELSRISVPRRTKKKLRMKRTRMAIVTIPAVMSMEICWKILKKTITRETAAWRMLWRD